MIKEEPSVSSSNCEKIATEEKDLIIHVELHYPDEYSPTTSKCGSCDYESDSEIDLDQHLKTHNKKECEFCGYVCLS